MQPGQPASRRSRTMRLSDHAKTGTSETHLKLHADQSNALNTVTAYDDTSIEVNLVRYPHSILLLPEDPVERWEITRFEDLTPEHFEQVLRHQPEVVVFGSGQTLRFPHPRLTANLLRQRIGVDTMDVKAASRTYNILMAEGRKVAALLLIEGTADGGSDGAAPRPAEA